MAMSPDQYRGKRKELERAIERANRCMSGLTEDGLWCPIVLDDDIEKAKEALNRGIGRMEECLNGLRPYSPNREKYKQGIVDAEEALVRLKEFERMLGR